MKLLRSYRFLTLMMSGCVLFQLSLCTGDPRTTLGKLLTLIVGLRFGNF